MKKFATLLLTPISFFLVLDICQGQEQNDMIKAFEQSYQYEYNGDLTKAISSLKTVYQKDSYELNLRLGWLNYMAGFFTESLACYQKSMDIHPFSIEAKFGHIYPASALNHWEQVKRSYLEILKIDEQNKFANYSLGLIYFNNENYEDAGKHFEKVVNLYPFDYNGLLMLAWTNLKSGKFREAKILFNKVLLYQPNDKSALEGLSMIK